MTRPSFLLAALALALLGGCPPSIIDGGGDVALGAGTTSGTGGGGKGGTSTSGTGGAPVCAPGATASCYHGPAGTEGVGICKAGAQTCAADGMSWGACVGEVLPQPEDCASGTDLHCDGQVAPCVGNPLWAQGFGLDVYGARVAVDALGDVFLTGIFEGEMNVGGDPLVCPGGACVVLAKFGPDGSHLWSKRFDGTVGLYLWPGVVPVAADASGNVLLTSNFSGTIDFSGGMAPLTSAAMSTDVFIAKFGPDGSYLWSKNSSGSGIQAPTSIAVDASGNVLVTGYFSGSADFGTGAPLTSAGGQDIFVAKLGSDGSPLWSKRFGDPTDQQANGVAVDASANVLVTGNFSGLVDFSGGSAPLTSAGGQDIFIAKLDPDGSHLWSKRFGDGMHHDAGQSVAADASGNVVLTGQFSGTVDFGGSAPLTSGGASADVFVAKLDAATGAHVWSNQFSGGGAADSSSGESVAVGADGNVLVTGEFAGTVNFGGSLLASAGGLDVFLTKLHAKTGAPLWSKRFGDSQDQYGRGVAADVSGNALVAGDTWGGSIYFGVGKTFGAANSKTIYLAKFSP